MTANGQNLKVLFLSSDTGGGHRASAESLARQFELLFPGSTYDLLDVFEKAIYPYNKMAEHYKHLSAHPSQWKLVFKATNHKAFEYFFDISHRHLSEKMIRKSIQEYDPDVVVSVHPLMTNIPVLSCQKIFEETQRYLPIFTVVTDLGSAHCLWFANGVDKMFIASDEIRSLAKARGKVPDEKLVQIGLPIRHDFAVQAELLGERFSTEGKAYQKQVKVELGLEDMLVEEKKTEEEEENNEVTEGAEEQKEVTPFLDRKTVLVMGGGEGVGSLSNIVNSLYVELSLHDIDAVLLVVCGRNEALKQDLKERDWNQVLEEDLKRRNEMRKRRNRRAFEFPSLTKCADGMGSVLKPTTSGELSTSAGTCIPGPFTHGIRKILSNSSLGQMSRENALVHSQHSDNFSLSVGGFDSESSVLRPVSPANSSTLPSMLEANDEEEEEEEQEEQGDKKDGEEPDLDQSSYDSPESYPDIDPYATSGDFGLEEEDKTRDVKPTGKVSVIGLGFVTKMAEYMVASDVLVSKAGPGTIAEAASLSLPVMLTSFLPGQEEGNVDFVVAGGFGTFISDSDPYGVAEEVADWLKDDEKREDLSKRAKARGAPNAARDIVKNIGDISLKWKKINTHRDQLDRAADLLRQGIMPSDSD